MDPLSQLKDIHLGQTYGLWPPAYGWWILISVFFMLLLVACLYLKRRHRQRLAIREALKQLKNYQQQDNWPQALNTLLKRLCISYFTNKQVAGLHQQQWLEFLTQQLPIKKQAKFAQDYRLLLEELYQRPKANLELEHYQNLCQQWIKQTLPPTKKQREVQDV